MKQGVKKGIIYLWMLCMLMSLTACRGEKNSAGQKEDTSAVAGEYYLDLTELGMKLTVYLQMTEEGTFLFSNTLDFATNKSSGTLQAAEQGYVMVFDSVNGEEKNISEGITASFRVTEEGNLDFSVCDTVPYGSANINTISPDDPEVVLMAYPVTADYNAPSEKTEFQPGIYQAEEVEQNGIYYSHTISFYEDETYLHFVTYEENGIQKYVSETGRYGVSTTQLALEPEGGEETTGRVESEVVDEKNLNVSVYGYAGAKERSTISFAKVDTVSMIASYSGRGEITGTDQTFPVELTIYEDGSYDAVAENFTESGLLAMDTEKSYVKQYPDHPETGARGLSLVATVPAGKLEDHKIAELRVRTSDNLTRYLANVTK